MRKSRGEKGQAVPVLIIALSAVLIGALGLALDASNLYQQTQRAQSAADAAAMAAMKSVYMGSNTIAANTAKFSTSSTITCTTSDTELPCQYAALNGFGQTASDKVTVEFPTCGGSPDPCAGFSGSLAANYTPNVVKVTITRDTNNTIMKLLGAGTTSSIKAAGVAAIVAKSVPTPIIVTHPTLANSLSINGGTTLAICGGPDISIQVNSSADTSPNGFAFAPSNGTIDLSHAGDSVQPPPTNPCAETGATMRVLGGQDTQPPSSILKLGTTGKYLPHTGPILDPFRDVPPPSTTGLTVDPTPTPVTFGSGDCKNPAATGGCWLYHPGLYDDSASWEPNSCKGGLKPGCNSKGPYVLFAPGIYYIQHNSNSFSDFGVDFGGVIGGGVDANGNAGYAMCATCTADPDTKMGVLFYDTGPAGSTYPNVPAGGFNIGTGANLIIMGPNKTTVDASGQTVPDKPYYTIAFWEDRSANARPTNHPHIFGTGNGCFTLDNASIYVTNTLGIMTSTNGAQYQAVKYAGTPCGTTQDRGDIIVGTLTMDGGATITMNLIPFSYAFVYQVALVGGGPQKD